MTVNLVLMEPPVVTMAKMFHYITATALANTAVKTVKVQNACYFFFCHLFFFLYNNEIFSSLLFQAIHKIPSLVQYVMVSKI